MTRQARPATLALALLLAAGCSGLHSNTPVTQVYALAPPAAPAAPGATPQDATATPLAIGPTLRVVRPLAAPGLDTERIALTHGARLDYYAASAWPAPLPEVLQALTVEALRASGRYRAVQTDATAFAAERVLQLEIRRFQADYAGDGAPTVRVQLVATLGARDDRSLIASVEATAAVPAGENRMQAVVAAFQSAVDDALAQLAARLPAAP